MNTPYQNQFDTCVVARVDLDQMPRECKSLNHISVTVIVAKWFKRQLGRRGITCPIHVGYIYFHFFCLLPVPHSSAEPM